MHQKGLHSINALLKNKIVDNFYVPVKTMNKCIKEATETCLQCNILHPTTQKRYVGLGRSLNEHIASNKNFFATLLILK